MVKYVLLYESGPETASKAPLHVAEHRSRWREFQESGALLMIGPFTNPAFGAMGVFASSEAAHAFAEGDPFVVNGVVADWHVREWNEVLAP